MAESIQDLYLKYVNKVGKTLETDRYFRYLFEMIQAGDNTFMQHYQVLHKVVDERWLSTIEESLDSINSIIEKPRRFIATKEEVVPVSLAKKITGESVRHLSQNTQFIADAEDGEVQPTKILNVTVEESYDLYENRFIYYLIQRLVTFIDKRTDVIFWSTGDEKRNTMTMESHVDDAYEQISYKLEMTIKQVQSFAENDSENMNVFMRIDRVRRMVLALKTSAFCSIMQGCQKVRSPISRTNLMMKDPDYRNCYKLWQFLENYDEVGYSIDVKDSLLEYDEEYMIQMYSNMITNYAVFKSLLEADPRKLDEAQAKRRKVLKPKFVKQIQEQIVDNYDIPDVEVRKVIIEEVTQAQLDAEAKAAEETAKREETEKMLEEAELATQKANQQVMDMMTMQGQLQQELEQSEQEKQAANETIENLRVQLTQLEEEKKRADQDKIQAEADKKAAEDAKEEAEYTLRTTQEAQSEIQKSLDEALREKVEIQAQMTLAQRSKEEAKLMILRAKQAQQDADKRVAALTGAEEIVRTAREKQNDAEQKLADALSEISQLKAQLERTATEKETESELCKKLEAKLAASEKVLSATEMLNKIAEQERDAALAAKEASDRELVIAKKDKEAAEAAADAEAQGKREAEANAKEALERLAELETKKSRPFFGR